jgi:hypothetical protein
MVAAVPVSNDEARLIRRYMRQIQAAAFEGDSARPIVCAFTTAQATALLRRWYRRHPVKVEQGDPAIVGERLIAFGAMSEQDMADAFPEETSFVERFRTRGDGLFVVLLLPSGVTGCIIRGIE